MFDLEPSIVEWRRQMLAAGIRNPEPLEELESHLREEFERQMRSGLSKPQAFEAATRQIGQARALNNEFKNSERTFMTRTLIILLGIFGVLFGPAIFLPALALYKHQAILDSRVMIPMTIGAAITLIGLTTTIYGFKRRKA
jgi:hypothetical protein